METVDAIIETMKKVSEPMSAGQIADAAGIDRKEIDKLFEKRGKADDILIVKNGFITDTSIANIAFFDGKKWFTPKTCLLRGTTRERLLKEKKIFEKDIRVEDIKRYKKIALLNAMIGFYIVENCIITK